MLSQGQFPQASVSKIKQLWRPGEWVKKAEGGRHSGSDKGENLSLSNSSRELSGGSESQGTAWSLQKHHGPAAFVVSHSALLYPALDEFSSASHREAQCRGVLGSALSPNCHNHKATVAKGSHTSPLVTLAITAHLSYIIHTGRPVLSCGLLPRAAGIPQGTRLTCFHIPRATNETWQVALQYLDA